MADQPAWMTQDRPKWMTAPTGVQPPTPKFLATPEPKHEAATGVTQPSIQDRHRVEPESPIGWLTRQAGDKSNPMVGRVAAAVPVAIGDIIAQIYGGVTLPGDVATGKVDPMSREGITRAADLSMVAGPKEVGAPGPKAPPISEAAKAGPEAVGKALAPRPTVEDLKGLGDPAKPSDFEKPKLVAETPTPQPSAKEPPKLSVVKPEDTPAFLKDAAKFTMRFIQGEEPNQFSILPEGTPELSENKLNSHGLHIEKGTDSYRVIGSLLPEADRGKGKALAMYEHVLAMAEKDGVPLVSDDNVTTEATKIYDALRRRGYRVIKNPIAEEGMGALITEDGSPVYTIMPRNTKPEATGAAPSHPADILQGTIADREKAAVTPDLKQNLKELAVAIRSISSPDKATPEGARAGASIRSSIGRATRDSEKTRAALEGYQKQVSAYSPQDKLDIIDSMQNWSDRRAQGYEPIPEVKPLFDAIRQTFEDRKAKLMAAPSTERMRFIDDYYPQMWKDPEKAKSFAQSFGTKEGSSGFTKARSIPTVADGIRAGLEPVTIDPIEATFRYVENVDRFLATNEVFDTAVERGDVVWRTPGQEPAGWRQVQGRKNQPMTGQVPYAPEGWATVYNRFISRPPEGLAGKALQGLQKTANSITAFKLGISGYHALNMVGESVRSGIANALDEAFYGNPVKAAAALGKAYGKPITSAIRGRQMQKAYLHDVGSPELRKVVDLATEANFRVAGKGRIADEYRFTGAGSLLDSWRRGALQMELKQGVYNLKRDPLYVKPFRAAKQIATGIGRVLETASDPLFKYYIPAIKNGAFYDIVSTWLREHPEAAHEEQVAFARKASDIVDNNFGEMNQDNIFWQKWTKQMAQSAFVSYSYTLGTARQVAGTAGDLARIGKDGWSNNLSQAVALPIMVGTLGAIYQYAKTGKPPASPRDLVAPQTGGTDATTGQPERAVMPSYLQQFLNGTMDPRQEATNKLNGLYELLHGAFTGTDWRGDPIAPSTAGPGEVLKNYLEMAAGTWQPISTENRGKIGTHIGGVERFGGMKAAPMFLTDPEGYAAMKRKQGARADKLKARHDATHARTYGGTQ